MTPVTAVIPARYESTRFRGKPLALLKGREVILWVADQAHKCKTVTEVLVATDDERIQKVVETAGYRAVMTSPRHACGTDRIAEAVTDSTTEIVVNIQGDEPMIDPASVDEAVTALLRAPSLNVATLAVPISDPAEYSDPNAVKVVFDSNNMALYFSRSPIPYNRAKMENPLFHKHLGLYVYRRRFLLEFSRMEQTVLEKAEMLEQLRILQNGVPIKIIITRKDSIGIDTPDDLRRVESLLNV